MVREGDRTPYNMLIENCTVNACWKEVMKQSSFEQRLRDVTTFNRSVQSRALNFVSKAVYWPYLSKNLLDVL